MKDYLPSQGYLPFQGRKYLFTRGVQQGIGDRGLLRIRVQNMGWDNAYAKLTNIPRVVRTRLQGALQANADRVVSVAKEYVPHGRETNLLYDSITRKAVGGPNSLAYTVIADTPYAHFVEADVHTSYSRKTRWTVKSGPTIAGSVFGARQGPPQGPHYMQRATEDTEVESHNNVRSAFNRAIAEAVSSARGSGKGGLDFDTKVGAQSFAFAKAGIDIGLDSPISRSGGGDLSPLDMALGGFDA